MGVIPTRMMPLGAWRQSAPPLPYDAEVDWVATGGSQYVDTGLTITSGYIAFSFTAISSNTNAAFLGQQVANPRLLGWIINNSDAYVDVGASSSRVDFDSHMPDMVLAKTAFTGSTTAGCVPLYLFTSRAINGPRTPYAKVRCAYAQFWDAQGVLVRDFVPVRIGTSGYLYDRANPTGGPLGNGLYGSATATPLVAGPDKIPS